MFGYATTNHLCHFHYLFPLCIEIVFGYILGLLILGRHSFLWLVSKMPPAFKFHKKLIKDPSNKEENYWAVCDKKDCEFLSKRSIRAKDMPKDQYMVSVFGFVFILFYFIFFLHCKNNKQTKHTHTNTNTVYCLRQLVT